MSLVNYKESEASFCILSKMPINFIIESICDEKRNHGEYRIIKVGVSGIVIRFDEPLKRYTYTKVGGPADCCFSS